MFSTVTYAFPEDVISTIPSTMEDCDFSLYFPLLTEIIFHFLKFVKYDLYQ